MNLLPPGKSRTGVDRSTTSSPSSSRLAVSRMVRVSMPEPQLSPLDQATDFGRRQKPLLDKEDAPGKVWLSVPVPSTVQPTGDQSQTTHLVTDRMTFVSVRIKTTAKTHFSNNIDNLSQVKKI